MHLLDLFCGVGGASMGYHMAGFDDITGIDIKDQPHYPFNFIRADALEYLLEHENKFDAIHASPPCQFISKAVKKIYRTGRPNLIPETRDMLKKTGLPYVIENVPSAYEYLIEPIRLCGSSFGLPIKRHRLFESNIWLWGKQCSHKEYPRQYPPAWNRETLLRVLSVSGGYQKRESLQEHKEAMGMEWVKTWHELGEAIPPVYTEFIGKDIISYLRRKL